MRRVREGQGLAGATENAGFHRVPGLLTFPPRCFGRPQLNLFYAKAFPFPVLKCIFSAESRIIPAEPSERQRFKPTTKMAWTVQRFAGPDKSPVPRLTGATVVSSLRKSSLLISAFCRDVENVLINLRRPGLVRGCNVDGWADSKQSPAPPSLHLPVLASARWPSAKK